MTKYLQFIRCAPLDDSEGTFSIVNEHNKKSFPDFLASVNEIIGLYCDYLESNCSHKKDLEIVAWFSKGYSKGGFCVCKRSKKREFIRSILQRREGFKRQWSYEELFSLNWLEFEKLVNDNVQSSSLIFDERFYSYIKLKKRHYAFLTAVDAGHNGDVKRQKNYWGEFKFESKSDSIKEILDTGSKWPNCFEKT